MNAHFRLSLAACVLGGALALTGCASGADKTTGGTPVHVPETHCTVDQDCPDPTFFICNTAASLCEPACRTREDCGVAKRGPSFSIEQCDANPLGCQCDANRCVVSLCSADADCGGGLACRDGQCVAPPAASEVAGCRVVPEVVIGRSGEPVHFEVLATDASGQPVVPREGATWTALGARVTGGGQGSEATFTLAEAGAEDAAVQAQLGNTTCLARVTVLSEKVPSGQVRAVVTDELTGRPIPGALVAVSDAQGFITASAETDAGGVALVPVKGEVSVTAFHGDFGYLTVARYNTSKGSRHLALALRRNPVDGYGGFKGTLRNVPATTHLHAALAGLSIPGLATDLSGAQLTGPLRAARINVLGQARDISLPANAFVALGADAVQTDISAMGTAGVCDASLTGADLVESSILGGACGTRTAWALAGDVPLSELPPSLLSPTPDMGQVLAQSIPLFRRFNSAVARDVQFRLVSTPGADTGAPDFHDVAQFAPLDLDFQQMRLGFQFAVRVPALPQYRGAYLDGAFLLGGASVPGRGLVPLGLGVAVNTTPADPNTDTQSGLPSPGLVSVRMAPTHHGLEGSPYRLLVIANSNAAANDASAGAASSALVGQVPGGRLPFDPKGAAPVDLSGAFLPIPEGARYNFNPDAYQGLEGRQFRFVTTPDLSAATLLRVGFTHRAGRRWTVLLDPALASTGFHLPVPPAPYEDRTYFGDNLGTRSRLLVQALSAHASEGSALGPAALAESRDATERLADLTSAISVLDSGRPDVSWVVPSEDGGRLVPGGTVRVRVTGFKLGSAATDDGYVLLSLSGALGCDGVTVRGDVDVSQGQGEVDLRLPAGCQGSGIALTATLVDPSGVPLRPAVVGSRSVNILP